MKKLDCNIRNADKFKFSKLSDNGMSDAEKEEINELLSEVILRIF